MASFFALQLLQWQVENPRVLPWDNGPRDPYHIWISEIIMQQTRIEQGAPYYLKFISRFPNVRALSDATVDEVLSYWQGLGYYSRARNLHKAARYIADLCNGRFPESYDDLLQLPGVGPYSAAAIASFAYQLPYPVVDGNVKRVIARFAGNTNSIDDPSTHRDIQTLAGKYMKGASPGDFNQAIMNFGAIVCKPKNPLCNICPLSKKCIAFKENKTTLIPIRSKKKTNEVRYFHFFIIRWKEKLLLGRREEKDIWQGLYCPPLLERKNKNKPPEKEINHLLNCYTGHFTYTLHSASPPQQQLLSHQTIIGRFYEIRLLSAPILKRENLVWVNSKTLLDYGKPKMVVGMLEKQKVL